MWYFSWILGVGLAASFAILNGMWYEIRGDEKNTEQLQPDAADTSEPASKNHGDPT